MKETFWDKNRALIMGWLPYLVLSYWLFRTRPTIWLDEAALGHAADWYTLPYGPLAGLLPLSAEKIRALAKVLPIFNVFGLVLFAVPARRFRVVGGFVAGIAALIMDGINYGSGKIDHQAISHSLPALLAMGDLMGHELLFLKSGLCFFYLQSVAGKVLSGWPNVHLFAFRDWLLLYRDFYGVATPIGNWLLTHLHSLFLWKVADYVVLLSEGLILLLWLTIRLNRYLAMEALLLFHVMILLVFGIDFTKLLLPVYWWAMRERTAAGATGSEWCWSAWGVLALLLSIFLTPEMQFLTLSILNFAGFYFDRRPFNGFLAQREWQVAPPRWKAWLLGSWGLFNCATIALAIAGYEPFPSYGGPIFPGSASHGDCTGACQVTLVESGGRSGADAENVRTSLSQLGLDPRSGVVTGSNLGAQLKRLGLDPRSWVPKLVQYLVANGLADHDGIHCLNHDFLPSPTAAQRITEAVKETAAERNFEVQVHWSTYGNCSSQP